ncbi:ATP-dependent Clp protease adapter ClpS [Rickettsiales bacterium]|nr:ATP-dependent Clp protease adapter ClpS [Rickettsiales bacterium]
MISNQINDNENNIDNQNDVNTVIKEEIKVKKPDLFKVILLNDDYTPMEYVVGLLKKVFNKNQDEAINVMLTIHQKGSGICGIYTLEIAETKANSVMKMAKKDQHPLQCIIEKE